MPRNYIVPHRGTTLYFVKELGRGQFGTARAVRNDRACVFCLKEVSMKGRGDTSRHEAQTEVNLMTKVREHPNIIRYYDHWFDARAMFILMEYAPNGALDRVIASHRSEGRKFTEFQVLHYLQQLASAIAFLHNEVRMLHRDLKPENVLMGQFGELKLADFGLSKALTPGNDLCATFVGSPLYMSPELCMGEEYSFSTDIWALGCIVYEIMALQSPWVDVCVAAGGPGTIPALLKKISCTPLKFDILQAHYKSNAVKTVQWMLRKTASERPSASQILDLLEIREPPTHHEDDTRQKDKGQGIVPKRMTELTVDQAVEQEEIPEELANEKMPEKIPPIKTAVVTSLERRQDLVREATKLAEDNTRAAMRIQDSFRKSRTTAKPRRAPLAVPKRVVPQPVRSPAEMALDQTLAEPHSVYPPYAKSSKEKQVEVIQRAMRVSLNRRRLYAAAPTPKTTNLYSKPTQRLVKPADMGPPHPPKNHYNAPYPHHCSARIQQLAVPRPLRTAPLCTTPLPPQGRIMVKRTPPTTRLPQRPSQPIRPTQPVRPPTSPRPAWM